MEANEQLQYHCTPVHQRLRLATPPPSPTEWDASPSKGYPQQYVYVASTPFIHLGGERQYCPRETTRSQGLRLEPPTFRSEKASPWPSTFFITVVAFGVLFAPEAHLSRVSSRLQINYSEFFCLTT